MSNLIINYDLINPGQSYQRVGDAIKSLGSWAHVLESCWYVSSAMSASQALNVVRAAADANDKILVVDASSNDAAWVNLSPNVAEHIKKSWRSMSSGLLSAGRGF